MHEIKPIIDPLPREELLRELNRELGVTLVLVTHDLGVAEQAERILHLTDGKIVRDSGEAAI